ATHRDEQQDHKPRCDRRRDQQTEAGTPQSGAEELGEPHCTAARVKTRMETRVMSAAKRATTARLSAALAVVLPDFQMLCSPLLSCSIPHRSTASACVSGRNFAIH